MAIGKQLSDGNPDGTILGQNASDLIGFYGASGASQRAGSNQASSNLSSSASFGTLQQAIVQEIMATLTACSLWKGSA